MSEEEKDGYNYFMESNKEASCDEADDIDETSIEERKNLEVKTSEEDTQE